MIRIMRILFLHQNFPGQFKHLAPALATAGHQVVAAPMRKGPPAQWQGVRLWPYWPSRGSAAGVHPWVVDLETKAIRAEACTRQLLRLRDAGFDPEIVVAHPGWGEGLGVKMLWPRTRLGLYCEFYYREHGQDVDFDPEFSKGDPLDALRLQYKNVNSDMHFAAADAAIAPTRWQASTYPAAFQDRIEVVHDGIDTRALQPSAAGRFALPDGRVLTKSDEVITFVSRNLEPYRGFHIFMRSLPALLQRRPAAQVLLIGADGVGYGAPSADGSSWRARLSAEILPQLSPEQRGRVHFLGQLPYADYLAALQVSGAHCYLTYPFVLSWSLLEAMSLECPIVASNTPPVREVIKHDRSGLLVDFFDRGALVDAIMAVLDDRALASRLGRTARDVVRQRYELNDVCLPAQLRWIEKLQGA